MERNVRSIPARPKDKLVLLWRISSVSEWLGFVQVFLLSVTPFFLSHKVRYSLRHETTPAPQMPDVWLNEAGLSVSFTHLKTPAGENLWAFCFYEAGISTPEYTECISVPIAEQSHSRHLECLFLQMPHTAHRIPRFPAVVRYPRRWWRKGAACWDNST